MQYYDRLREARKAKHISQEKAGEAIGVAQKQISRWETGENEIGAIALTELCKLYGISADWVMGLK